MTAGDTGQRNNEPQGLCGGAMAVTVEDSEIFAPWANGFAVLVGHDS
jgi:hypothetical protein